MSNTNDSTQKCNERSIDSPLGPGADPFFRLLFERSTDAISLFDPITGRFIESNDAVVRQTGAPDKAALGHASPVEISPEYQPDGRLSREKAEEMVKLALAKGSHRFEWMSRRFDGTDLPIDVVLTAISTGDRPLLLCVSRDISEKKKAEAAAHRLQATLEQRVAERTAALSASEERLRTLVEHAPEAIVVFEGETGRLEAANENAVLLFGRPREQLLGLTSVDLSPAFQADGRPSSVVAREKIQAALDGGTPVFDWLHQHPQGRLFVSEVRLVRLPSEGRQLVRASIIDHTERRRREQTQRAVYEISEAVHAVADLPSLYARIHGIVCGLMPADNFFIALFDAATELITFPYFVDEQATELPEPRRVSTGLTGLVLRTGKAILADRRFTERCRREGQTIVVEDLGGVSYIESGEPAAVWLGVPLVVQGRAIGVMAVQNYCNENAYGQEEKQILTFVATQTALAIERKQAEECLRELVEKHRAIFEASTQGVLLQDEHKFLEVNPAAVRILGRKSAEEVVGHRPRDFAPEFQPNGESSDGLARRYIAECIEKGSARFEWTSLKPDGQLAPLDVLLTRVQWGGRWIIQAMVEDITERKQAEVELLKTLAREQELSQMKTNFVSAVSHEFRTPLAIIMSSAQILADYFDELQPAERREHLLSVTRNTQLMSSLMEEVLLLSRVDAGRMAWEPAPLDLRGFCLRLTEEVLSATQRRCPIVLQIPDDCAQARGDERLLRHIFTNLLSNAVKYSPAGSAVEFEVRRDGVTAFCFIRDQGIGIPETDREWLFTAFHRARNVGERPGTGLGLTIVKRCVELHGGRISLDSEVGRGTTITVRLPLFA
ncbi:MAG TPA: PAS domain S-box protein [Verrucomicrobiae bacterium]|nr:PAS domain S-box protein [Verrucomicrobiae bacterium]